MHEVWIQRAMMIRIHKKQKKKKTKKQKTESFIVHNQNVLLHRKKVNNIRM